jgi:glycosyltransferase involved in cell wall biosynthesis
MPEKVLLIGLHHPELVPGGAQQVCYELFQELRSRPDTTCWLLASADSTWPALFKSGARITGFDGRDGEYLFLSRDFDHWWQKTNDPLLVAAFIEFLEILRPDVVHFHHFMAFGIDFITIVRRVLPRCRIIFTLHEFMAICAADGQMVRRTDKSLCDRASQLRCHQCLPEHSPEQFMVRKMWFMAHLELVDRFACPSRFMIRHFVDWGLPAEKIAHVPNGQRRYGSAQPKDLLPGRRNRFGFFGQMHDTKGVHIILRAVRILRAQGFTDFRIDLNGANIRFATAAMREEIETFLADEAALPADQQIVFDNGSYHVDRLATRMARVDWCIVPSVWWEIFGLVISEAWMFGKPVICSDVGGMAERVADDEDGLHFVMGDPRALAACIQRAATEDGLWQRLHDNLPQPPARDVMGDDYLRLYAEAQTEPPA